MKAKILILTIFLIVGFIGSFDAYSTDTLSDGKSGVYINSIKMPENTENIYVHKLSTDKHSSQFVVFVRQFVPTHKHEHHSESVYVLSGEGEFNLNGQVSKISSGHFIYIPEGAVHGVKTTSKEPLKVLSVQAPEFFGKDRVPVPSR